MLRKLGLAISYFIAIVYFLSILLPSIYCLRHGCRGPGEGDAFMPGFFLIPYGGIATAFSLWDAIQHIRKRQAMVLGFLACCNCLRDCSSRHTGLYCAPDLFHCISSAVGRVCLHLSERRRLLLRRVAR